jgi:isopropylmalate/homocitrate/citramalate synthase
MRPRGRLAAVLAGLAAGVGLSGCVGHGTVSGAGYRANVVRTAEQISLAIASARMGVQLDLDGKMPLPMTDQTVSQAARTADTEASALAGRKPASQGESTLYRQASASVQHAVSALRALRDAVSRGERDGIGRALSGLDAPSRELDDLRHVAGR